MAATTFTEVKVDADTLENPREQEVSELNTHCVGFVLLRDLTILNKSIFWTKSGSMIWHLLCV